MGSGGARLRSGPAPDLNSARSERLGRMNGALRLPASGYKGTPPEYPLLDDAIDQELALWHELWKTPQAAAWATMAYQWHLVALYVRYTVRASQPDAAANLMTTALRMGDAIGMTPAGMAGLGWVIDTDDIVIRDDDVVKNPKVVTMHQRRQLPGDKRGR